MTRANGSWFLKLLALLTIAAGTVPTEAQETPQQCAAIVEDAARLACYDALFRETLPGGGTEPIVVQSQRLIPARPSGREPATMTIACGDTGMSVTFAFAGQLVSNTGDIAAMTYQVDSGATIVRTMRADPDNTRLRFDSARETAAFLDNLVGGTRVKVRMTPVRQRSVTVDFRIDDVAEELAALSAGCAS